jgi:hypothetical protein
MSARYLVTHTPHYINQRMVHPDCGADSIVTLPEGVKPGRWLVLQEEAPATAPASTQPTDLPEKYKAKHNGGGRWVVENTEDGSRASVVFEKDDGDAKAKAEAEAARLNAGGEISLGATDSAPSSAQTDPAASTKNDDLPDA